MPISNIHTFNRLFNEYYHRFVRFAGGYVKERALAEDFVSEAFAAYWENRSTLQPDTKPQAYILTIVKNKCLNHLQRQQVRQRAEKEIGEHSEWLLSTQINTLQACDPIYLFSDEIQQIIGNTLAKLPPKTREIFELSRNEGLSYAEIARQMNLSHKAVEFHISKVLKLLRISLKDFLCVIPFILYL